MEKTIYQIAFLETIVFSCADADTIITFGSSGLRWWMSSDNGQFMLVDTLDTYNDLNRAPIAYARKLASDWFDYSMNRVVDDSVQAPDTTTVYPDSSSVAVNTNFTPTRTVTVVAKPEKDFPIVEPMWVDEDKKDAHTEHCCATHRHCFYGKRKCSVVSGKKPPSYPCRCKEKERAA